MNLPTEEQIRAALEALVKERFFSQLDANAKHLVDNSEAFIKLSAVMCAIHMGIEPKAGFMEKLIDQAEPSDKTGTSITRALTAGLILGLKIQGGTGAPAATGPLPNNIQMALALSEMIKDQYIDNLGKTTAELLTSSNVLTGLVACQVGLYLDLGPDEMDQIMERMAGDHIKEAAAITKSMVTGLMLGWRAAQMIGGKAVDALNGLIKRRKEAGEPSEALDELLAKAKETVKSMKDNGKPKTKAKAKGGWK